MRRAVKAAYWTVPSLLCVLIYWLGLKSWFQQDDFAWLAMNRVYRATGDLWPILFEPKAQGTIRPLSERAFFLLFNGVFGLHALPFHIAVFLTEFVNLVLVCAIGRRLTSSRAAGFLAAVLWIANGTLATAVSWISAYNQVLCAFFILVSFWCLLRYIETEKRRYNVMQWAAFLLGFGALEINVVYPAIALCYTVLAARKYFLRMLWLLLPAGIYAAVHWHLAPNPTSGPYLLHPDASMLPTLWTYWQWALSPVRLDLAGIVVPSWLLLSATILLTAALLGFAASRLIRGNRLSVFLLLWFLILVAPILPLRDHLSDYYLTMPTIGLAILAAWALSEAWQGGRWHTKTAALTLVAIYLACSLPVARAGARWRYNRGRAAQFLVLGLARAAELHPGKTILLSGLSSELFWSTIGDKAYQLVGIEELYLTPGSEETIARFDDLGRVSDYVLPPAIVLRALEDGWAVVYEVGQGRPRNVTSTYLASARVRFSDPQQPLRIDVGSPLFTGQLGPTWHSIEGGFRWMPERATVVLGGPASPGAKLYLSGFCPAQQVASKPLGVTVRVDGITVGRARLSQPDASFDLIFPMPAQTVGKVKVEVAIEVERTFAAGSDRRALGLVFGTIAIR
jgi:hypothetical protein